MRLLIYFSITFLTSFAFATVDCPQNYPNGNTLTYSSGAMNYPNGNTLRYSSGSMNNPDGSTNHTGSISLSAPFGSDEMRIVVRPNTAHFETTIAYGAGILLIELDEDGNVTCTVEGGSGANEFHLDGTLGSAYVTVKPGQDARALKAAVQKALDGN